MERSPTFLMANLGSEVSQVFRHSENGDENAAKLSAERAEIIFTELLKHPELKGRTKEVEILRELVQDALSQKKNFEISKKDMEEYFMPFIARVSPLSK